jgi:hypothetical protein
MILISFNDIVMVTEWNGSVITFYVVQGTIAKSTYRDEGNSRENCQRKMDTHTCFLRFYYISFVERICFSCIQHISHCDSFWPVVVENQIGRK